LRRRTFLIVEGVQDMHNFCPFCKNPLTPWYQWKAADGRLYCNEFCADACDSTKDFAPQKSQLGESNAQRA
jgi:hypothetical protein